MVIHERPASSCGDGGDGGGGGDGLGGGGDCGNGQAVWQTYLRIVSQGKSFHVVEVHTPKS